MNVQAAAAIILLLQAGPIVAARAADAGRDPASPASVCRLAGNDDRLQPIARSLVPATRRLFAIQAPDTVVQRTTVFRCMQGAVMLCNAGANLPCGKADEARTLPGATAWCRSHPGAPDIPMVATGHDTIYRWRCDGPHAQADGPPQRIDPRGFIAAVWKRVGR